MSILYQLLLEPIFDLFFGLTGFIFMKFITLGNYPKKFPRTLKKNSSPEYKAVDLFLCDLAGLAIWIGIFLIFYFFVF